MSLSVEEIVRVLGEHPYIPGGEWSVDVCGCDRHATQVVIYEIRDWRKHVAKALQAAMDAEKEATDATR